MQQMTGARSWDADYLAEAKRRINSLRREEEFATNRPVAENPRRHQVHFQEDQPVIDRATQVQVEMTAEEYNQWKEFSQMAEFRLQE
jgi:hypothetical protein